jgi:hypothetical protein
MHGQIGGDNYGSDVIPFARAAKDSALGDADQLDKAGQTILQLLHRAAGVAEADTRWRRHKSFRINCARPKIGSPS